MLPFSLLSLCCSSCPPYHPEIQFSYFSPTIHSEMNAHHSPANMTKRSISVGIFDGSHSVQVNISQKVKDFCYEFANISSFCVEIYNFSAYFHSNHSDNQICKFAEYKSEGEIQQAKRLIAIDLMAIDAKADTASIRAQQSGNLNIMKMYDEIVKCIIFAVWWKV